VALKLNGGPNPTFSVLWKYSGIDSGPAIIAAGAVWIVTIPTGTIYAFNPTTGAVLYSKALSTVEHFDTPAAGDGLIVVGANETVYAIDPAPSTTSSGSAVTVNSVDQNGGAITGYQTVLYNSAGNQINEGFTPITFTTTSGQTYSVRAESYGSCTFTKWSDGVTSDPRTFTATSSATTFTAAYDCAGASPYSTISVTSMNEVGSSVTGYTVTLLNSSTGATVATGTTPVTFTTRVDRTYKLEAQSSSGSCTFSFWNANSTTDLPLAFTATSSSQSTSAVYDCNGGGSTTVTIYAHRVPAGYWAPCFATVCAAGTGPGATMYFALRDSGGTLVATGFANEDGFTFTGLTAGATYYLTADNCDSCHGSTHDVLFDHWGGNSTADPVAVVAGSSLDAWYTCTNGCGGV